MEPEVELSQNDYLKDLSREEQQNVGIQCFVSDGGPIPAITKYLLTDFIVNQIDLQGKLITLKQKPNLEFCKQAKPQKEAVHYLMTGDLEKEICEVLGKQCAKEIQILYTRLESGEKMSQWSFVINDVPSQKEARLKIHNFVRQKLINIQSNTLDGNQMRLKFNKKMRKMNPALRKKYVYFTLFKSNLDTMGALLKLSKLTGINNKLFSSAGLKDKRGVTTQKISVYNTDISYLKRFYEHAGKNREMWIADFEENKDVDIGVGDLWGNQFGLILRLLEVSSGELIKKRIESLQKIGMINYFGMQRFGSCQTRTHMIGLMIVKKKWQKVVQTLLLQKTKDQRTNQLKEQCYQNKQYAKGQKLLPFKNKIEKSIFKSLQKYGQNYQNVFGSLPRSMRTLYCHALQSYIWNRIVSKRISEGGYELRAGDIVGKQLKGFQLAKKEAEENNEPLKEDDEVDFEKAEGESSYEPILVTAENIDEFTLEDVILPLYGPSLTIPAGSFAQKMIKEQLKLLQLQETDFLENAKLLCFKGQYRKMIVKPKQVRFKLIQHQDKKQELQSPFYTIGEEKQVKPGNCVSLHLQLQLPKSSYATMAIRQILHIPSSFEVQMHLNKLYDKND